VEIPDTRYAQSGDVNIAYQVFGGGPLDLVFVPGWVSHVEEAWEYPSFAAFLRRLGTFARVITFDKRGTGLSDAVPIDRLPTLEQRMDDVRAVMDAAASPRAAVFGVSEGGNMSVLFAATYPERTSALVTFGVYAKRVWSEDTYCRRSACRRSSSTAPATVTSTSKKGGGSHRRSRARATSSWTATTTCRGSVTSSRSSARSRSS
jgi:pimeloyl-ACP methyl ester carboxylesterase